MPRPLLRVAATAQGKKAKIHASVYLDAQLRDMLARHAFEHGRTLSSLLEEGGRAVLAGTAADRYLPRARWVDMTPTQLGATIPSPAGDGVATVFRFDDDQWKWRLQVGGAVFESEHGFRSLAAAQLETEAVAACVTHETVARQVASRARRGNRPR